MKFKSGGKNFGLWRALAASLALHAVLLWQAPPQPSAASRAAQPLAATLRQSIVEPAAPSPAVQPLAAASPAHGATHVATPAVNHATAPDSLSAPPMQTSAAPSTLPEADAQPAGAGPDAEGLRLYRLSLAAAARRFKRYPALAVDRGLSGRAEVAVAIAANGIAQPPRLASSSGHELLDEAALDMIARAAQATSLPHQLRGQAFAVRLPVLFDLDGE